MAVLNETITISLDVGVAPGSGLRWRIGTLLLRAAKFVLRQPFRIDVRQVVVNRK